MSELAHKATLRQNHKPEVGQYYIFSDGRAGLCIHSQPPTFYGSTAPFTLTLREFSRLKPEKVAVTRIS